MDRQGEAAAPFHELGTPCLLLDEVRLIKNLDRMSNRCRQLGVELRFHAKSCKSPEIVEKVLRHGAGSIVVSSLKEAEIFGAVDVKDQMYAVGISPSKMARVVALRRKGVDLQVVVDSEEQTEAVIAISSVAGDRLPILIEIDTDGHRSGLSLTDPERLVRLGRRIAEGAELRGVMTLAGGSYAVQGETALRQCAELERTTAKQAAAILGASGLECSTISVGSTPTVLFAATMAGITEVRAGVFPFMDLFQVSLGVCHPEDIALSVLTTVIGHRPEKDLIVIDAGWTALSLHRSVASNGLGVVCNLDGEPLADLIVVDANQEHGIVGKRQESSKPTPKLPIGTQLRILPNHACATAESHEGYWVLDTEAARTVRTYWPRFRGWL